MGTDVKITEVEEAMPDNWKIAGTYNRGRNPICNKCGKESNTIYVIYKNEQYDTDTVSHCKRCILKAAAVEAL